jgi:hypothetical protein
VCGFVGGLFWTISVGEWGHALGVCAQGVNNTRNTSASYTSANRSCASNGCKSGFARDQAHATSAE